MIDKSKYSSHGTFIKKIPQLGLSNWNKSKLAVINPIPSTKIKQKINNVTPNDIIICSQKAHTQHKFQQKVHKKPLAQELTQPFLYIQKVLKKTKVQNKNWKNLAPFMTSSIVKKRPASAINTNKQSIPKGYSNLYDYQEDKKQTASKIFKKLTDIQVSNLKDVYCMWNKKLNLQTNPQINVKQQKFIQFMKELLHGKVNEKLLKHFFQLYQNKNPQKIEKQKKQTNNILSNEQNLSGTKVISIKALSFNYDKYVRSQNQISNVMSEKSAKQRYTWIKQYLTDFDQSYSALKGSMNSIKNYQEGLRTHFKSMYKSYRNPFQAQIQQLKKQLQKPIIKYDKHKKDQLQNKILGYEEENNKIYQRITQQYHQMIESYEQTIVKNHDLFFAKRTICKLLLPILKQYPYLTKQLINLRIVECQRQKEDYLECLSSLVVQMDKDKKHLAEDCFTLEEVVNIILMKNKNNQNNQFTQDFMVKSMKKLVKEIKKQYLIKNDFLIQDIDQFPADQQIPLDILHTCFQMQCTKVLLKNQIWNQLTTLMPTSQTQSKFHKHTIACNECMQYLKRYFLKLDQRSNIQRNKSKQVSLLIQNANFQNMGFFAQVIDEVSIKLSDPYHDNDQQQLADRVPPLESKKKVGFADLAQSMIKQQNQQFYSKKQSQLQEQKKDQMQLVKSLLKSILDQPNKKSQIKNNKQVKKTESFRVSQNQNLQKKNIQIPQSLSALKTLSKSFIVPQGINTNSFDIRFYLKQNKKKQENLIQQELLRLGTSQLLSNLPRPEQIQSLNPLKISRFLQGNINKIIQQQKRILHQKNYESSVKEGVDNNYFRQKIKLQNRATRYDSQGKSKYSVLLPVGYYQSFIVNEAEKNDDKWYLRPHHVETLTENPLSKKDNLIHTEYQSKLDKIPLKKRPDQIIIQENVKRKDELINSLQERISSLKKDIIKKKNPSKLQGKPVSTTLLNQYFNNITAGKQDKQLQEAAYQGVLYDLRRKQKQLLVDFRQRQNFLNGEPEQKWWQKKDRTFNKQLRKDRILVSDSLKESSPHKQYVQKLKNQQIY